MAIVPEKPIFFVKFGNFIARLKIFIGHPTCSCLSVWFGSNWAQNTNTVMFKGFQRVVWLGPHDVESSMSVSVQNVVQCIRIIEWVLMISRLRKKLFKTDRNVRFLGWSYGDLYKKISFLLIGRQVIWITTCNIIYICFYKHYVCRHSYFQKT